MTDRLSFFPVYHEEHVAFYVSSGVTRDSPMRTSDVMMPDGTHPESGSRVVCGQCGEPFTPKLSGSDYLCQSTCEVAIQTRAFVQPKPKGSMWTRWIEFFRWLFR